MTLVIHLTPSKLRYDSNIGVKGRGYRHDDQSDATKGPNDDAGAVGSASTSLMRSSVADVGFNVCTQPLNESATRWLIREQPPAD